MNANLVESAANTAVATVFPLQRDAYGKLIWTTADNQRPDNVVPIRAFPIQSPDVGISLVNLDGQEVAWIEELSAVPEPAQTLIRNELASREFMPVISHIVGVASFSTPCTWTVKTDRGDTEFVLRGDEDIRRIGTEGTLLISDSHGIQYLVRDHFALDARSKKILDRFL
jgi:hypothetical protein